MIAVCALLSQVGSTQQFEPLLAAVAAGLVIENLSIAQGDALKTAVQGTALPVLVIFFVAVICPLLVGLSGNLPQLSTVHRRDAEDAEGITGDQEVRRSRCSPSTGFSAITHRPRRPRWLALRQRPRQLQSS